MISLAVSRRICRCCRCGTGEMSLLDCTSVGDSCWRATHASLLADGPASSSLQRTGSVTAMCCAQDDDTWIVTTEFPTDVAPSAMPAASITSTVSGHDGLAGLMTIGAALSAQEVAVSQQRSLVCGTPCAQLRIVCTSAGAPAVHSTITLPSSIRVPDLLSFQVRTRQLIESPWRETHACAYLRCLLCTAKHSTCSCWLKSTSYLCACVQRGTACH